ncbi:MAG: transposase, partial [Candidatus Cloacimonetes bacterium]|nr:transposase [Candidatus Cloacimonadota bacterium]
MSTYTQILYHIVFSTKDRRRTLEIAKREQILHYAWGVLKNHNTFVYQINIVEDHMHILCSLHPSNTLSDLVKLLKTALGNWMKENHISKSFSGWQQ